MSDDSIILAIDGGVATITLNRPDAGNAIDMPLAKALRAAAEQCAADEAVRCVVLTGAGKLFCAGGDVAGMAQAGDERPAFIGGLIEQLHAAQLVLAEMPKPLLNAINGPAAGAGFGLAISGDVVVAGESASFMAAYPAVGLTADGGLSWLLPRLAGMRTAQRLMILNEKVSAADAVALGLVTQVVPDAELAATAQALAQRLAGGSMQSAAGVRRLLLESLQSDYAGQLTREQASMMQAAAGPENAEGVAAFLERRKPDFQKAK